MSFQQTTQHLIKDPMEIILGTSISDAECVLMDILVCYETQDHYTVELMENATVPHHLQKLKDICITAFSSILSADVSTFSPTNTSPALVMYNLGKLMRETINDDTYLRTIQNLETELRYKLDGVTLTTEDSTTYARDVAKMIHLPGQGSDDMFGSWSSTQWRPIDDCIAGILATWMYILHHWGVQVCTYFSKKHVRGIGEYISSGGAIEGRLKKLNPYDEADWPLRYLSTYNGVGDAFGITASMVDNEYLKGIEVPIVDTVEPFIQKFFSTSRWVWRYMRWIEVTPIYSILPPKIADKTAPAVNSAYTDLSYMALFGSGKRRSADGNNDYDWDWWNNELVNFTQRLQRFKFRGKNGAAFGKWKSRIKLTSVFELPDPGGPGLGGIFWHQMASARIDVDVGGDDNFIVFRDRPIKEGSDLSYTPNTTVPPDVLRMYRNKDSYYWFQLIGDIDMDMYQFILGTHMTKVKTRTGSVTAMRGDTVQTDLMPEFYELPYSPCGVVVFDVEKDEDEGYYVQSTAQSYTFDPLEDDSGYTYFGSTTCIYDWADVSEAIVGTANYDDSVHELNLARPDFYDMRSNDPYKKLSHRVFDANNLDAVAIRNALSKYYIASTPGLEVALSAKLSDKPVSQRKNGTTDETYVKKPDEVAISAIPDDDSVESNDDEISEKPISAEIPISVTPESVKKAEKALKDMKLQLSKDKKKEEAEKKKTEDKK